jgi:hypothetical protein
MDVSTSFKETGCAVCSMSTDAILLTVSRSEGQGSVLSGPCIMRRRMTDISTPSSLRSPSASGGVRDSVPRIPDQHPASATSRATSLFRNAV